MTGIMNFINGFFTALQTILSWMLDGLAYVLKTVIYFVFDGLLTVVSGIISAVDISNVLVSAASTWNAMPPQLLYVIHQIGIPQGLTILGYAYLIRMGLNLIPAALTRI